MLKKLFNLLALFAFLSLACFVVLLFYNKPGTLVSLIKPYHRGYENLTFTWLMKQHIDELWNLKTEAVKSSQRTKWTPVTMQKVLGPCPDTPPDLKGPFNVEFSKKMTMDEVRKEVSSGLQEGGRYRPPDCVSRHKVAIIIPFRNRHEHLKYWLYFLHPLLKRQQLDYGVFVINQDGDGVFNRAKLMNAGYAEVSREHGYDCFVFSDVDLVPVDDRNLYRCFENPRHLAVAMDKFNYGLPYSQYFGGVSALSKSQYLKINGFPNTYWGWGGEDDDIFRRVYYHGMSLSRPDMMTGRYKMIKHVRDLHNEPNPNNPYKLGHTHHTMGKDGINSLRYTVKEKLKRDLYTWISVDIEAPAS